MQAIVDLEDSRITLRFEYSQDGVARAKSVPGGRWNPTAKAWTYHPDMQTCKLLRKAFGNGLVIANNLRNWAVAEINREQTIRETAAIDLTHSVDLEIVPRMAPKLYAAMQAKGYQPPAVKFGALVRNVLIADAPGLGKTIETLGTLIESGTSGRVLIVAPRTSLRATWKPEILKWLDDDYQGFFGVQVVDANTGNKNMRISHINNYLADWDAIRFPGEYFTLERHDPKKALHFLIVNPEMLRAKRVINENGKSSVVYDYPQFGQIQWDAVIVDESHRYLLNANPRAKKCSQWGLGLAYLNINPKGQRIALSGTPMKGKPRRIWHTLRWLNPEKYTSEWSWSKRYFETEYDAYSATGEKLTDNLKPENEAAFNDELGKVMIRRTKPELRKINPQWAPPDKQYMEVWIPMLPKQKKLYDQMFAETEAEMDGQVLMANGVLAILTRLKQFATSAGRMEAGSFYPAAPSNKIDWLIDDFIPSRDNKIVIASQYSKVIDLVESELSKAKVDCYKLTGATKDADRQEMIQEFQNDPESPRVFLLTTTAGGVSVTLDAADDLVLLDETWVPDDQEQVEDRIHRTSNVNHQVNIYYVRSLDTIEAEIAETVEMKDTSQKRVLDGRRGIEYAKNKFHVKVNSKN